MVGNRWTNMTRKGCGKEKVIHFRLYCTMFAIFFLSANTISTKIFGQYDKSRSKFTIYGAKCEYVRIFYNKFVLLNFSSVALLLILCTLHLYVLRVTTIANTFTEAVVKQLLWFLYPHNHYLETVFDKPQRRREIFGIL